MVQEPTDIQIAGEFGDKAVGPPLVCPFFPRCSDELDFLAGDTLLKAHFPRVLIEEGAPTVETDSNELMVVVPVERTHKAASLTTVAGGVTAEPDRARETEHVGPDWTTRVTIDDAITGRVMRGASPAC